MAIGSVTVGTTNSYSSSFNEAERTFLYIGSGGSDAQSGVLNLSATSDLDSLFGSGDSNLKTQVAAAISNSRDSNFFAYAYCLGEDETWDGVALPLLDKPSDLDVEAVVVVDPVATSTAVIAGQTFADNCLSKYAKFVCVHMCVAGISSSETWSTYQTKIKAYISSVTADRVSVTPLLHGNDLGCVCGRLCDPAVSVADSPMRTATGTLIDLGATPSDSAGVSLDVAIITDLANSRFSVPQWYAGVEGYYWADCPLLDVITGDFTVYEHRRILDYLARRVRLLAISRIADRTLNSSSAGISASQTFFCRPLRTAATDGMIETPASDDIAIAWTSSTEVAIAISATPYDSPKKIAVTIGLTV